MNKPARIHPQALISPRASIGEGVTVEAFAVIGDDVEIGADTCIGPYCLIEGPARIGCRNQLVGHSSVGTSPQDLKYKGGPTTLEIGNDNVIREFVTINRGTETGLGRTVIGSNNLIMTGAHIAHDCIVGSNVIMANAATLAGHVLVEDHSNVGAFTGVHQFCRVGRYAFIGGYSVITRDALPFIKTVGSRGEGNIYGINSIGLERKGFSPEQIKALKAAYRVLFHSKGMTLKERIEILRQSGALTPEVEILVDFMETSERGFTR